jgi:hypothetical protein
LCDDHIRFFHDLLGFLFLFRLAAYLLRGDSDMDSAMKTGRMFPAYTLVELKAAIAAGRGTEAMMAEVAAREAGASKVFAVPQIVPLKA